jgi:hypothetical protein
MQALQEVAFSAALIYPAGQSLQAIASRTSCSSKKDPIVHETHAGVPGTCW